MYRGATASPIVLASVLLLVGGLFFLISAVSRAEWGQAIGGIVVGAGVTVVTSTITGREAVRQQYAKEANVARKETLYGPLHADLIALRACLDRALRGESSYPLLIAGTDMTGSADDRVPEGIIPTDSRVSDGPHPTVERWMAFRADYRIDAFTLEARQLLDRVVACAKAYNAASEALHGAAIETVRQQLTAALTDLVACREFREWQQRRTDQLMRGLQNPVDESCWYGSLFPNPSEMPDDVAATLAQIWIDGERIRPQTVGWVLAGRPDMAARCLDGPVYVRGLRPDPPPVTWREDIFAGALLALQSAPAYEQARRTAHELHTAASAAEDKLTAGLCYIRDHFEGGMPPV